MASRIPDFNKTYQAAQQKALESYLLFYVVNGVRYGVKPSRGNKHDIDWYFNQLKTGMQADKGYSTGLTQYLNAWLRKKDLQIVFKGNA